MDARNSRISDIAENAEDIAQPEHDADGDKPVQDVLDLGVHRHIGVDQVEQHAYQNERNYDCQHGNLATDLRCGTAEARLRTFARDRSREHTVQATAWTDYEALCALDCLSVAVAQAGLVALCCHLLAQVIPFSGA